MSTITSTAQLCWLSDLHLDRASVRYRKDFCGQLRCRAEGGFVITGDISDSAHLALHLRELAAAVAPRRILFVLGNHDFYGSSFKMVEGIVAGVCRVCPNLHHLDGSEVVELSAETAVIGHRGWSDGRMGHGARSRIDNPDFTSIDDFRGLTREAAFSLMRELGRESARHFRDTLPRALRRYRQVIVATHFPPFTRAACFDGKPCGYAWQPFFTNISAGATLLRISENFPGRRVTVLCGHAHCPSRIRISANLEVLTSGARPGYPSIEQSIVV